MMTSIDTIEKKEKEIAPLVLFTKRQNMLKFETGHDQTIDHLKTFYLVNLNVKPFARER